jgi:hypothetical protein
VIAHDTLREGLRKRLCDVLRLNAANMFRLALEKSFSVRVVDLALVPDFHVDLHLLTSSKGQAMIEQIAAKEFGLNVTYEERKKHQWGEFIFTPSQLQWTQNPSQCLHE